MEVKRVDRNLSWEEEVHDSSSSRRSKGEEVRNRFLDEAITSDGVPFCNTRYDQRKQHRERKDELTLKEENDRHKEVRVYLVLLSKDKERIFHLHLVLPLDRRHSQGVHREVEEDQSESTDRKERHKERDDREEVRFFRKVREEEL